MEGFDKFDECMVAIFIKVLPIMESFMFTRTLQLLASYHVTEFKTLTVKTLVAS